VSYKRSSLDGKVRCHRRDLLHWGSMSCGLAAGLAPTSPNFARSDMWTRPRRKLRGFGDLTSVFVRRQQTAVSARCLRERWRIGHVYILVNDRWQAKRTPVLDVRSEVERNHGDNLTGSLRRDRSLGPPYGGLAWLRAHPPHRFSSSLLALPRGCGLRRQHSRLASLTRTMAIEWAGYGVCVNAIMPGVFRTALSTKTSGLTASVEFLHAHACEALR